MIDVHRHLLPEPYRDALRENGREVIDGFPVPDWSEAGLLSHMDDMGIERAICSYPAPGLGFRPPAERPALARRCNDYLADLIARHPQRLGGFALLPLPDVGATLDEIEHALGALNLDGVGALTNHDGLYLGAATFDPVLAELDRREAPLFIHPTAPETNPPDIGSPPPVLDYPYETARVATSLVLHRIPERFPGVKIILTHAGGALPILAGRIAFAAGELGLADGTTGARAKTITDASLRSFYFDLALTTDAAVIGFLTNFCGTDQILAGSDAPFAPGHLLLTQNALLEQAGLTPETLTANALKVLTRHRGTDPAP